jgi:3-oxoacid CoA-transferase subunit A
VLPLIYLTGDPHGNFDRIEEFCGRFKTTRDDIMIILGDAGINYYGGKKDKRLKEELSSWPVTFFMVRGNHEKNPENIPSYIESTFLDGSVLIEPEYPNLIFAKDGEVYSFIVDEKPKKAIVIGGAYSVDKYYRLSKGYRWFEDEQPSDEVKTRVEKKLSHMNWKVDYVLTHTAPIRYEPMEWFLSMIDQSTVDNSTEIWLDEIFQKLQFEKWYCGHYHGEKTIDKITFMFNGFKALGE